MKKGERVMKTVYFDMDGVMAKYDYDLYVPKRENEVPPFLKLGSHVFLYLEPMKNVMEAFNILYKRYKDNPDVRIKVLTSIPVGLLQAEHTLDKYTWCVSNIEEFHTEDFFCTSVKKHNAIADTLWNLTENDILVDDWNANLYNWREHGGYALKLVNEINSVNPDFDYIKSAWDSKRIAESIISLIEGEAA